MKPIVHHFCKSHAMASFGILVVHSASVVVWRMDGCFFLLIMEYVEMAGVSLNDKSYKFLFRM